MEPKNSFEIRSEKIYGGEKAFPSTKLAQNLLQEVLGPVHEVHHGHETHTQVEFHYHACAILRHMHIVVAKDQSL